MWRTQVGTKTGVVMRTSYILQLAAMLALALPIAQEQAAAAPNTRGERSGLKTFKVANRSFTGTAKTICVLEGSWADGESFRYEAWDRCDKITIEWVRAKSTPQTVEQVHGRNKTFVIPAGSEGFIVANDHSRVWLFRDKEGEVQEILISD